MINIKLLQIPKQHTYIYFAILSCGSISNAGIVGFVDSDKQASHFEYVPSSYLVVFAFHGENKQDLPPAPLDCGEREP